VIPGVTVTTEMKILCSGHTFEITSVENVKGRGMYLEVLGTEGEKEWLKRHGKCRRSFL
jgi:hypothetical protein